MPIRDICDVDLIQELFQMGVLRCQLHLQSTNRRALGLHARATGLRVLGREAFVHAELAHSLVCEREGTRLDTIMR